VRPSTSSLRTNGFVEAVDPSGANAFEEEAEGATAKRGITGPADMFEASLGLVFGAGLGIAGTLFLFQNSSLRLGAGAEVFAAEDVFAEKDASGQPSADGTRLPRRAPDVDARVCSSL
jgi:hypothetical protein